MITASIVTYNDHLLDIEGILRSLLKSPVEKLWIIDHSDVVDSLRYELEEYMKVDEDYLTHSGRGFFDISYERLPNRGYAHGHNIALRRAIEQGSTYHLVVNPDVWFGADVIPALWKYMESNTDVAQIMPRVLFLDGRVQCLAKRLPTPMDMFGRILLPEKWIAERNKRFELRHLSWDEPINAPCLSGCFMFFRVEALKDVGLFDERFFLYAEDFDLTRRIHEKYKTIFYPLVSIYHKFNRQSHRDLRLFLVHLWSMCLYFFKWGWFLDGDRRRINHEC